MAATKKTQPASKVCGVDGCGREVAKGTKLRLTSLESPTVYPNAVDGKLSTCKHHKICVNLAGFSMDTHPPQSSCPNTAKVFYLGQPFCESCHNTYLEALVAQCRPALTTSVIEVVRRQVSAVNSTPVPVVAPTPAAAPTISVVPPPKGKATKKTATPPAPAPPPPPPPPPPPTKEDSEEDEEEVEEDEEDDVPVIKVAALQKSKKDVHDDEDEDAVKVAKATAAVKAAKPVKAKA